MSSVSEAGALPTSEGAASAGHVEYHFSCQGFVDELVVGSFEAIEELNRPYRIVLHLEATHEAVDASELLGRDASLRVERFGLGRTFCGIVGRVTIRDHARAGQRSIVEIVPALLALERTVDTRIFQQKSALEIAETVLGVELAKYDRAVDTVSLERERYLVRDYCVQYGESSFDFVHRLLEEEGIGYFFRHDGEVETMVLFDDNADLRRASTMDDGAVRYDAAERAWAGSEPIVRFTQSFEPAPSKVTVRDHDWARGRPKVEASTPAAGATTGRHAHEIYEHGFARQVTIHEDGGALGTMVEALVRAALPVDLMPGIPQGVIDLPGLVLDAFTSSNAERQATLRWEERTRDERVSCGLGMVTGFSPGCSFELAGHPAFGVDGVYLLTKVQHTSKPEEGASGGEHHNYENRFECTPIATRWRPRRRTRKPRIYGVQTARVTGPAGTDVHTDHHGRIKVRFHWDRAGEDLFGNYTCWLRVSQTWAGHGAPGFMFIPRVGMEVVVSFIDGDPDRPLVTGCVYNGENPTPGLLPVQATKSILRTRTVPHGAGFNELSFEDAMGMECVHLRAQRDLDELVLANHHTAVGGSQINQVDVDQQETVMRHQRLEVNGQRVVRVRGRHTIASNSDHHLNVGGTAGVHVGRGYEVGVQNGSAVVHVDRGDFVARAKQALVLIQSPERYFEISGREDDSGVMLCCEGSTVHLTKDAIELKIGASTIRMTAQMVQINNKTFPAE